MNEEPLMYGGIPIKIVDSFEMSFEQALLVSNGISIGGIYPRGYLRRQSRKARRKRLKEAKNQPIQTSL